MEIDVRIRVKDGENIEALLASLWGTHDDVQSIVLLKNDGFAHILPDETTRVGQTHPAVRMHRPTSDGRPREDERYGA